MKKKSIDVPALIYIGILLILMGVLLMVKYDYKLENLIININSINKEELSSANETQQEEIQISKIANVVDSLSITTPVINIREEVYNGMTLSELSEKLNRSLKGSLAGKGEIYASKSLELNVDPYIAVAISLHETGCNWNCSSLTTQCYNVGGIKGSPSCGSSGYKRYSSLDEGITAFIETLSYGYYSKGLTTPELIGPRYAGSTTWAAAINSYITQIASK